MNSKMLYVAGMNTESEFPDAYLNFIRQHDIPYAIKRDNARPEITQCVRKIHRDLVLADQWTEARSYVRTQQNSMVLNICRTGAPVSMWFLAQDNLGYVHNLSTNRQIDWKISEQVSNGGAPGISHILTFYWFEPVLYLDPVSKFPETTEKPGYFVVFTDNVGDSLNYRVTQKFFYLLQMPTSK
jgi:hypothetical protein